MSGLGAMLTESICRSVQENGHDYIISTFGLDGFVLYGPYERVEPGSYVALFTIESVEAVDGLENRLCGAVDVVSHFGELSYGRRQIFASELAEGRTTIAVPFNVYEPADFEYRVWVSGEIGLKVAKQVDVARLTTPLASNQARGFGFPTLAQGPLPQALVGNVAGFRRLYEKGADIEVSGLSITAVANGKVVDATDGDIGRVARALWRFGFALEENYADAREDVILLQALHDVSRDDGFYIDIGANDPTVGSVTKLFYDRGWRGINVDASPRWCARLTEERPRDINIQAAVSDIPGEIVFFDDPVNGLGTSDEATALRHLQEFRVHTDRITVGTRTLAAICQEHAPADIHFLKVDVEGHEGPVLRSMDFARFRPWILCIEATEPMHVEVKTFQNWDRLLVGARYVLAAADQLNRYYVAVERSYLLGRFKHLPEGQVKSGWEL